MSPPAVLFAPVAAPPRRVTGCPSADGVVTCGPDAGPAPDGGREPR